MSSEENAAEIEQLVEGLRHSLSRLLQRGARDFASGTIAKLHGRGYVGLSTAHMAPLAYLEQGGTFVSLLAKWVGITKQSMSQLIGEMAALGYVSRMVDPANRRTTCVRLTTAVYSLSG